MLGLFLLGLSVTLLILVVVHNPSFFLIFLLLSSLVFCFLAWNKCSLRGKVAIFDLLGSSPDSDLASASDGQLVKVTGVCVIMCSLVLTFEDFLAFSLQVFVA